MKIIRDIQLKMGRMLLRNKKKSVTRNFKAIGFQKATEIGVLYDATNRNEYETVKRFINYLIEERKKVLALGYINSKDSSEIIKAHLNYQYFDNRNVSKVLIPQGRDIENFIASPYSILIDLTTKPCFQTEYITTLSKARFKVGAAGDYRDRECDLTIQLTDNTSLEFFITQLKHYLKMINN